MFRFVLFLLGTGLACQICPRTVMGRTPCSRAYACVNATCLVSLDTLISIDARPGCKELAARTCRAWDMFPCRVRPVRLGRDAPQPATELQPTTEPTTEPPLHWTCAPCRVRPVRQRGDAPEPTTEPTTEPPHATEPPLHWTCAFLRWIESPIAHALGIVFVCLVTSILILRCAVRCFRWSRGLCTGGRSGRSGRSAKSEGMQLASM